MPIPLIALAIGSAAAAGIGAAGSAANNKKARREEQRAYNRAQAYLNSDYYRSPLESTGNRALLKTLDSRLEKNNEAIDNRAAAGGATVENVLAAKQNMNEAVSDTYAQLLRGEDARRQGIRSQQLGLDQSHSQALQNSYRESANTWSNWGNATASAIMSYGMSSQLGGGSLLGGAGKAAAVQSTPVISNPNPANLATYDFSGLYSIPKPGAITI